MAHTSQDVSGDATRDGALPSRAVAPPGFHRPVVQLEGFSCERLTEFSLWCGGHWALHFGNAISFEAVVWLTEEAVDRLIGELLAAREQFRMEREARARPAGVVEMACPVPDSDEDVPF